MGRASKHWGVCLKCRGFFFYGFLVSPSYGPFGANNGPTCSCHFKRSWDSFLKWDFPHEAASCHAPKSGSWRQVWERLEEADAENQKSTQLPPGVGVFSDDAYPSGAVALVLGGHWWLIGGERFLKCIKCRPHHRWRWELKTTSYFIYFYVFIFHCFWRSILSLSLCLFSEPQFSVDS